MARTTIATRSSGGRAGVRVVAAAIPANYDTTNKVQVSNSGKTLLLLRTGASVDTFTFTQVALDGATTPGSKAVTLAANDEYVVGPFPVAVYGSTLLVDATNAGSTVIPLEVAST